MAAVLLLVHAAHVALLHAERAVVGRDDLQVVGLQRGPQRILRPLVAQGWRHDVLGDREVVAVVDRVVEEQVVRAGLGEDRDAGVARLHHVLEGLARRQVHEVHRRVGQLRQLDAAMRGLALQDRRPRQCVVARRGVALRQRLADQQLDDVAVLGMQRHHAAMLADQAHGLEDGGIVDHHAARIGHEHLEAAHALVADGVLHVAQDGLVDVRQDDVEAIVDAGADRRPGLRARDGVERALVLALEGEVDDGGGAAEGRRARAGLVVVAGGRVAEGVVQVGVAVDAAGQHQQAGGVNHPGVRADVEPLADHGDLAVLEQHVGVVVVHGRDDAAVADQGAVAHAAAPWVVSRPAACRARASIATSSAGSGPIGARMASLGMWPSSFRHVFRRALAWPPGAVP